MTVPGSPRRKVVIAGGGVAALEAALALRELACDYVGVELLASQPLFWYRPASVAEPFGLGEARHFELAEVAAAAGAGLTLGTLVSIDSARHEAHLAEGMVVSYDCLLVACGAVPSVAIPGALTFRGPEDSGAFSGLLAEIEAGAVHSVAFVVPWGATWVLPLYELALMTAAWLRARRIDDVELVLVTPENEPLELFGSVASETVRDLLDDRGITLQTGSFASDTGDGRLRLFPQESIAADRVVALPRLLGQPIGGLPQTIEGFIPVDEQGSVADTDDVFAAGDITNFPVKQGGIATQQAVAAAEAIAGWAGVDLEPQPFRPVLRGMLLTGAQPRYLRREIGADEDTSWVSETPIWWPPAKIVGRHLAPFLATLAGVETPTEDLAHEGAVPVAVELDAQDVDRLAGRRLEPFLADVPEEKTMATVGDVMSREPLVVAPEDTLGEVAERMSRLGTGSALVAQYGELIGILTARDLLHALAGRVHSSDARVRQWMTAQPIVVSTDTSIDKAALLMTEYGIHHLPVVDGEHPVGMIGLRAATRPHATAVQPAIGLGF